MSKHRPLLLQEEVRVVVVGDAGAARGGQHKGAVGQGPGRAPAVARALGVGKMGRGSKAWRLNHETEVSFGEEMTRSVSGVMDAYKRHP